MCRSSRLLRLTTPTPSAALTSSSSSRRTSSSLCLTVLPSSLERRSSLTGAHLPSRKCEVLGLGGRDVWLNDYVMAMACRQDKDRRRKEHVSTTQHTGKDDLDVTLVLCSDPFDFHVKKIGFDYSAKHHLSRIIYTASYLREEK